MGTLDEISLNDESWDNARQLVHRHFSSASTIWGLVRNSWSGGIDEKEFFKLFSFTGLPPHCLLQAANVKIDQGLSADKIFLAVQTLGVPLASVVVAINLACSSALMESPGPLWRKTYQELITLVEIGYRFGGRVHELGSAAGCLAGFGVGCGMLVALNENAQYLREWLAKTRSRHSKKAKTALGAEISQISGFMIQHLGFGHETAMGVAFGSGGNLKANLILPPQTLTWCAICRWIEALRNSRNYPGDLTLRSMFPAINPPTPGSGQRNAAPEVLYSEVAPIVRDGSKWTWHLPKSNYEETEKFVNDRSRQGKQ